MVFLSSSSVFLFSPVLAGDDFGAFDVDFFLPRVTWVHPSSLLLGGPQFLSVVYLEC